MSVPSVEDLETLTRDLAHAVRALRLARRALVTGPLPARDDLGPLDTLRHVAGQRTYAALLARPKIGRAHV